MHIKKSNSQVKEKEIELKKINASIDANIHSYKINYHEKVLDNWVDPFLYEFKIKEVNPILCGITLKNHILLCGAGDESDDVALFVSAYQECGGKENIVVLAPKSPDKWWHILCKSTGVYFIQGNPKFSKDLKRFFFFSPFYNFKIYYIYDILFFF